MKTNKPELKLFKIKGIKHGIESVTSKYFKTYSEAYIYGLNHFNDVFECKEYIGFITAEWI